MIDQKKQLPCLTIVVVVLDALPLPLYVGAAVQPPLPLTGNTVVAAAVDDDDTAAQLLLGPLIHVTTVAGTLYPDTIVLIP